MASTITINANSPSTAVVGTDEVTVSAVLQHLQRMKIFDGTVGGTAPLLVDSSNRAAVAEADGANVALGAKADALALTGTVSLIALIKGLISELPSSLGQKTMANALAVSLASDQSYVSQGNLTATGTLTTVGNTVQITVAGYQGVSYQQSGTYAGGTIVPEYSVDGGVTWNGTSVYDVFNGAAYTQVGPGNNTNKGYPLITPAGTTHMRVRLTAITSGSISITMTATAVGGNPTSLATLIQGGSQAYITNNALQVQPLPMVDRTTTATTMNAGGSVVNLSVEGYQSAGFLIVNTSLTAAMVVKGSVDGGTTYSMNLPYGASSNNIGSVYTAAFNFTADSTTQAFYVVLLPGMTHIQLAFSSYTSGSSLVTGRASTVQNQDPVWVVEGSYDAATAAFTRSGGMDGAGLSRELRLNNASGPGTSDWGLVTRDQANMGQSVLANAVTSPASAITTVQSSGIITGLDKFRSLMIAARLLGATGGALDVYLQSSPDSGTTWYDVVHFPQIPAAQAVKGFLVTINRTGQTGMTPVVVNGADGTPALPSNTVVQGDWGDRLRYVFVGGAGTTAGAAQTIKISGAT